MGVGEDVGHRFRWEWVGVLGLDGNGCRMLAMDFEWIGFGVLR